MFARPSASDFRHLASLAVPVTFVQVGLMAMGVVDTMIVGRISAAGLGAVALGSVYLFGVGTFAMGLLMALDPVVAQSVGAGDTAGVARGIQRGLLLSVVLSIVTGVALLPAEAVLRALGQPPEVVALAGPYIRIQAPTMIGFFAFLVLRQSLQAMGRTRPIVMIIVLANLLNAALNWVFIFGHLGAPAMGVLGSGLATGISRVSMAAGLLALSWHDLKPALVPWRRDTLDLRAIGRMVKLGAPIGVQYQLEYSVFALVAVLMGRIGTVQMAGHQIAINLASLTFMVPLGVSSAASVLVGHAVGAGDARQAQRSGVAALAAGVGFMGLSAITLTAFPRLLASAYTNDAAVIAFTATLIPIAGMFQLFDGAQVVAIGVLRGAGDTRTPMIVNLLGYWMIGLPVSLWLGFRTSLGARGLWWGLVLGLAIVAIVLVLRVRQKLWSRLERVVIDHPAEVLDS